MANKKSRKQKVYNMVGCSKKTRKNHLGGSEFAYTGKPVFSYPNPNLAYTGKGGNSLYPNKDPVSIGANTIFNNAANQRGGCNGMCALQSGGSRRRPNIGGSCSLCSSSFMVGGVRHRSGCKCSDCKVKRSDMKGGMPGFVGSDWTPNGHWPGVNGSNNHYSLNTYNNDVTRQMVDLGGNKPFLKGGKKRKQRGGALSNFIGQDLINLGRQFQFGVGSAYNALAGYSSPVNPLPWKDQLPNRTLLNPSTI